MRVLKLFITWVFLISISGCSPSSIEISSTGLNPQEAKPCQPLINSLPNALVGQFRQAVYPSEISAAAWGEGPVIVLRCGVGTPAGFNKDSGCQTVNGVDWFIPEDISPKATSMTLTTIGRTPNLEVVLPKKFFPPANLMASLSKVIKTKTKLRKKCL